MENKDIWLLFFSPMFIVIHRKIFFNIFNIKIVNVKIKILSNETHFLKYF